MAEPLLIAKHAQTECHLLPGLANRHGLITGATGTGKTVTLQTLAEQFSRIGVPVFMADVKGDLTGVSQAGRIGDKLAREQSVLLRQSYTRVAKRAAMMAGRYAHAKQFKRMDQGGSSNRRHGRASSFTSFCRARGEPRAVSLFASSEMANTPGDSGAKSIGDRPLRSASTNVSSWGTVPRMGRLWREQ